MVQAALAGDGDQVKHCAAGRCGCEHLGVDGAESVWVAEAGIENGEVAAEDGFEPAFRLEAEEGIAGGRGGIATFEEAIHEVAEEVFRGFVEEGFVEACTEEDFVAMGEGAWDEAVTDAGVFEAVEREGDFGGAAGADFCGFEEAGRQ